MLYFCKYEFQIFDTMKNTILIASLMCCLISASAQPIKKESKQRSWEESLELVEKTNRHDRAYTMELDSVTSEYTKIVLDYDAHSNCTWLALYFLDDEWILGPSYEYHYDEFDRLITMIDYDVAIKEEYIYNAQSLVEEIHYSYYETGGIWKTYGKTVLSYDDDDHVTLAMYYGYVDGEWMESSKETWDYEVGLLQVNTTSFINENGEWVDDRRTEYHYDGDGLCTEMIVSQWSEIWYYESKTVYHYDAQQQCYEKIEYGYGEGWYELYKNTYEYDAAGNLHIETTYFYQSSAQDWTYRNRYEYLYDEDNNCTDYYEYFYYVYDETWELEEVYHTAYGTPGIECIAGLSLIWDLFEFEFPIHNKVEQLVLDEDGDLFILDFHYSSTVGIAEQNGNVLTLWPNPTRDKVVVEGLEAAEVQVYNALGQLVKTMRDTNEVSVADLVEGVYLLRITDIEGKKHVTRVAVKE